MHFVSPYGYGRITIQGRTKFAHRVSYESYVGPIPQHYQINHRCNNSICINPAHLYAGTKSDNIADQVTAGVRQIGTKLCIDDVKHLRSNGWSNAAIGRHCGVSGQYIGRILADNTHWWANRKISVHKAQSGKCAGCMSEVPIECSEIDHIMPRSKGGTDSLDNLQMLCPSCNSVKNNGSMAELLDKIKQHRNPMREYKESVSHLFT